MKYLAGLRPSPAMVVALGGIGSAATVLPAASVGTAQLKSNAVTGAKVKNGSLTAADFPRAAPRWACRPRGCSRCSGTGRRARSRRSPGSQRMRQADLCRGYAHLAGPQHPGIRYRYLPAMRAACGRRGERDVATNTAIGAPIDSWGAFVDNRDTVNQSFSVYVLCAPATNVTANFKRAPSKR